MMTKPTRHSTEFKWNTVTMILEEGRVASQVARDLGMSEKTIYGWIAQDKNDPKHPFVGSGYMKPDAQTASNESHPTYSSNLSVLFAFIRESKDDAGVARRGRTCWAENSGAYHAGEWPEEPHSPQI